MAGRVGAFIFALTADNRTFNRAMRQSSKVISDQEKKFRKAQRAVRNFGRSLGAAAVGYASIRGLQQLAAQIGEVTGKSAELVETGRRIGFTTERLQLLGRVVEGEGGSFDKFITGLDRFSRSIAEAGDGVGEYKETFEKLGIAVTDGFGNLRSTEMIFDEVVQGLSEIEDRAARTQVAYDLFGRSNLALVNAAMKGVDALRDAEEGFRKLGVTTQQEDERLKALDQRLANLSTRLQQVSKEVVLGLEPAITRATVFAELATSTAGDLARSAFASTEDILSRSQEEMRRLGDTAIETSEKVTKQLIQDRERIAEAGRRVSGVEAPRRFGPDPLNLLEIRRAGEEPETGASALQQDAVDTKKYLNSMADEFESYSRRVGAYAERKLAADRRELDAQEAISRELTMQGRIEMRAMLEAEAMKELARARKEEQLAITEAQREELRLAREQAELNLEAVRRTDPSGGRTRRVALIGETAAGTTPVSDALEETKELGDTYSYVATRAQAAGESMARSFRGMGNSIRGVITQVDTLGEGLKRLLAIAGFNIFEAFLSPDNFRSIFGSAERRTRTIPLPSGTPRAGGGPVTAGVRYRVGEQGPEDFVAPMSGYIDPMPDRSGGDTVNNITIEGYDKDPRVLAYEIISAVEARQARREATKQLRERIA